MLNRLPIPKKYLLPIAAVGLLLLGYKLAFKQTFSAWAINNKLKTQLTQSTNLSYQPDYLKRKNINLDKVIELYKADTNAFRTYSINNASLIAEKENVKLSDVPEQSPSFNTSKFIVQKLDFEGDFFNLTKTLNRLRKTAGIGVIRSFSYKTVGNSLSQNKKLVLEVYFEIAK